MILIKKNFIIIHFTQLSILNTIYYRETHNYNLLFLILCLLAYDYCYVIVTMR